MTPGMFHASQMLQQKQAVRCFCNWPKLLGWTEHGQGKASRSLTLKMPCDSKFLVNWVLLLALQVSHMDMETREKLDYHQNQAILSGQILQKLRLSFSMRSFIFLSPRTGESEVLSDLFIIILLCF